ncbi:MAG: ABC-three component system protein [Candidatus Binataceae bacterium]
MIIAIRSSIATFKAVSFHRGLNVVLADTHPTSTEKQTRNSAGKTSLIEIIHFLLGADCDQDSLLRSAKLVEHTFYGTFEIGGDLFQVGRSGADPSKIFFLDSNLAAGHLPMKSDKNTGKEYVSNTNWRAFLGHRMFGLPQSARGTPYGESFSPTFRSMFSYFARRRDSGGFIRPEQQAEKQQRWDWQVNLSYLLGLDWQIPFEFQRIRTRERTLEELRKAAKGGAFGEVLGTVAELRPRLAIAETKTRKLRDQLSRFEVLDSYRDLSRRAAQLKGEMQEIAQREVSSHETIEHLTRALAAEKPPDPKDLERLYSAAGVQLPELALRRFDEVKQFHESVIANRRSHLQQEIDAANDQILADERRMGELDAERSEILRTLEGKGALEDFLRLQRELAALEAATATLREKFKSAEIIEGEATQLELDRINLKRRLQEDHQQRQKVLDEATLIIADAIAELYDDRIGKFVVDATENGSEFKISIEGDRGGGISNMEIFCFDLALFRLVTVRLGGPKFLLHDSHLFDGVDERQIARALLLGSRAAESLNSQYIVTMNSDIFDRLPLPKEIEPSKVVTPTRLSDQTETGGLFGFRFE